MKYVKQRMQQLPSLGVCSGAYLYL